MANISVIEIKLTNNWYKENFYKVIKIQYLQFYKDLF